MDYKDNFTTTYTNPFTGELFTGPSKLPEEDVPLFWDFVEHLETPRTFLTRGSTEKCPVIILQGTPTTLGTLFYSYYTWWQEDAEAYPWGWYFKMQLPEFAWTHALCVQGVCVNDYVRPIDSEVHDCVLLLGEGATEKATDKPATVGHFICGHCARREAITKGEALETAGGRQNGKRIITPVSSWTGETIHLVTEGN